MKEVSSGWQNIQFDQLPKAATASRQKCKFIQIYDILHNKPLREVIHYGNFRIKPYILKYIAIDGTYGQLLQWASYLMERSQLGTNGYLPLCKRRQYKWRMRLPPPTPPPTHIFRVDEALGDSILDPLVGEFIGWLCFIWLCYISLML